MIPNRSADVQVTNNITSENTGQFTVDQASLGKIMSVLTNLYSDPEMAVVREYLTNAYDAQVDAGMVVGQNWRPIEVTTPSHFQKEYKVRDFGVGLSVDDIKNVYSKYGKSTKENSNDVAGMLGLGSKCALTYTGQFTITGFKNGVRVSAVVSKDDNDIPVFMIVDTRATDEPNGVEISVPVRDRNTFAEKAAKFLRFWPKDSVLVNSQPVKGHGLKMVRKAPMTFNLAGKDEVHDVEVFLAEADTSGYRYNAPKSFIVMGNVPYAVDSQYIDSNLSQAGLGFIAYVPIGAIDFPPSREELFYNKRSKETVKKISEGLFEEVLSVRLKEIENAPDFPTAWRLKNQLEYHFANTSKARALKYKGLTFPDRIPYVHSELTWDWQGHGQISKKNFLNAGNAMTGALVVTGVPEDSKATSYFKKKVRHYIDSNNISASVAILGDADLDNRWFDWLPRIDAQTIKDIKLPKTGTVGPRTETPYDYYVRDSATKSISMLSDLIVPVPAGDTLVYISPQDMKETYRKQGTSASALLTQLGEGYILVVLGKNRFEKFLRTHPSAVTAEVALKAKVDSLVSKVSANERLVGELSYGETSFLEKVKPASLNDTDLAALAVAVQSKNGGVDNYTMAVNLCAYAKRASVHINPPVRALTITNPCKRYPLIDNNGSRNLNHMVIYVNAVYAAQNQSQQP